MKLPSSLQLSLLFIFTCLLAPRGYVHAVQLPFPTVEQFLSLPEDQQLAYLRDMREIAASMSHDSSLFAEYRHPFLQYLVLSTHTPVLAGSLNVEGEISRARQAFERFKSNYSSTSTSEAKQALAIEAFSILAAAFNTANEQNNQAAKVALLKEFRDLKSSLLSSTYRSGLEARTVSYVNSQTVRMQQSVSNPSSSTPGPRPSTRTPAPRSTAPARRPNPASTGTTPQKAERASPPPPPASANARTDSPKPPPPAPAPAATRTTDQASLQDLRARLTEKLQKLAPASDRSGCMYAGFILLGDSCEAPTSLPTQLLEKFKDGKILNTEKFKCSSGQALCNPLLFGFDIDEKAPEKQRNGCEKIDEMKDCFQHATPICIPSSILATKKCYEKSASDKYIHRALALIKAKPDSFTQYTENYSSICDKEFIDKNKFIHYDSSGKLRSNPEYYRNDILKTCEKAANRFESLYEMHFSTKFNFKSKSGSKGPNPDPAGGTPGGSTTGTTSNKPPDGKK